MLQHDLRTQEVNRRDPHSPIAMLGWCICGGWSTEVSNLFPSVMASRFLSHLSKVQEDRANTHPEFFQLIP